MRRRKVTYPTPKTATKGGSAARQDPREPGAGGRVVSIDLSAMRGGPALRVGDRVRIMSGLFAGEVAVVESASGGLIPAALVRTEAGRTRRARTIDLKPSDPAMDREAEGRAS